MEQGLLPNLARLFKTGASSRLQSTIPPITPCAWSSFMTGKNPGKHGIFDFTRPLPGTYDLEFVNGGGTGSLETTSADRRTAFQA